MPVVAEMRAWVLRWFDRSIPVGERLVAFGFVEGVLFSASFSALQWLRTRNLLPGITAANSFIARDEGVHTLFACLLVREYVLRRPTQERTETILSGAIEVVDKFVKESLPVRLIGMNAELMCQYVRYQADCVLYEMGYKMAYLVSNPFPFMDAMVLNEVSKVNFFEYRSTQYQTPASEKLSQLVLDDTPITI
jgi:ribonucleotide reductase beta subunit family protein with ferritin-like domain